MTRLTFLAALSLAACSEGTLGTGTGPLRVTHAEALPGVVNYLPLSGVAVAVDSHDNAVVVGPATWSDNDPGPAVSWFKGNTVSRTMTYAHAATPSAMALDSTDSIWLVGHLESSSPPVDFGGEPAAPVDGYYLAKLSSDGTQQFVKAIAAPGSTFLEGIATDGSGNAYVIGTRTPSGSIHESAFVSKFSPAGDPIFDQAFPGSDTVTTPRDVAIAPNGDVIIVGEFNATTQFGDFQVTSLGAAGYFMNAFVAVLSPTDGTPKQAFSFGGTTGDWAAAVDVTASGALRIVGDVSGRATIGGMSVQADSNGSAFVAELTPAGIANWALLGDGHTNLLQSDTNRAGRTFVVGWIGDATTSESIAGTVGSDHTLSLAVQVQTDNGGATHAAADRHGGVWVGGLFSGVADFGTGPLMGPDATTPTNFLLHLEPGPSQ
jgi:hypothetical protein